MKVISKYSLETIIIKHIEIIIIKHIKKYIINHTRAIFNNIIIINKFIFKGNLRLIYNYPIWLLKGKSAGHNTPTVNGVCEPSFLTDSLLTRGIMPCSSRLSDCVSEPFLSDYRPIETARLPKRES